MTRDKEKKRKKIYMHPQLFTIAILTILIATAIQVNAATRYNDTGVHDTVSGQKAFTKTDTVTFCKGRNSQDDTFKAINCDFVCRSTDLDCSTSANAAVGYAMNINVSLIDASSGTFMLQKPIIQQGFNMKFKGQGRQRTIFKINATNISNFGFNYAFGYNSSPFSNWEISDLSCDGSSTSSSSSGGCILITNGSFIHDVMIYNTSYFGIYGDPVNYPIIQRVYFTGYSGGDRIGGGNFHQASIADIYFVGNKSGDTNIDVLRYDDGTLTRVYESDEPSFNPVNIIFEPVRNSTISEIHIKGGVSIKSDSGYGPSTYSNSRHVHLSDIYAKSIYFVSGGSSTTSDQFGDFSVTRAFLNDTQNPLLLLQGLNDSRQLLNSFTFTDIVAYINPTAATLNSGLGVHRPAAIATNDNMTNVKIDRVHLVNLNTSVPTYAVELGQSFASVAGSGVHNASVNRLSCDNCSRLLNVRNADGLRTDVPLAQINSTTVAYADTDVLGNLTVRGTANFTSNITIGAINEYWNGSCKVENNTLSGGFLALC